MAILFFASSVDRLVRVVLDTAITSVVVRIPTTTTITMNLKELRKFYNPKLNSNLVSVRRHYRYATSPTTISKIVSQRFECT
jgi:hypothetical protein